MRVYSIGSWAHFGSLVISIAMLGFGVVSAVMCIGKDSFERHWSGWVRVSLLAYGPLMIAGNTLAQAYPFNPIFLATDPGQKYRLFASFVFYFVPFVPGALFLGLAFLKGKGQFGKVYFANMAGSGLGGLMFLGSMYLIMPDWLLLVPLGMWFVGAAIWFGAWRERRSLIVAAVLTLIAVVCAASFTQIYVLPYKGVSYARKFPDSKRIYNAASPLGQMEIYTSSYFHFAPGLSDMAAINLKKMPENAYLGMYIDGDGPIGIMKQIPRDLTAYFRFLPMYMPYLLHKDPNVFVVQFGGGISTEVALRAGAPHVTVAEGNPMVLDALGRDPTLTKLTDDVLADKRVTIIPYDGRLYVAGAHSKFDIVDLSLAEFDRPVERRRLLDLREIRLHQGSHARLHGGAARQRHPLGHGVEQAGSAEIGPEAVHDHGRGRRGAQSRRLRQALLRGAGLSLDRDRALQARRLHARRDRRRSSTTTRRCRSTSPIIPACSTTRATARPCSRAIATSISRRPSPR